MSLLSPLCMEIALDSHDDQRGVLVPLEFGRLPFQPKRAFYITGVPRGEMRAGHAHKTCQQILWPLRGSWDLQLSGRTGGTMHKRLLPNLKAVYVPPLTWVQLWADSEGCGLMVLASEPYSADDYIRDEDKFFLSGAALREETKRAAR